MTIFPNMRYLFLSSHFPRTEDEVETHLQGISIDCTSEHLAYISAFNSHIYSHIRETSHPYDSCKSPGKYNSKLRYGKVTHLTTVNSAFRKNY